MWKIEFTKQLSIELIYILHGREKDIRREKEKKQEMRKHVKGEGTD